MCRSIRRAWRASFFVAGLLAAGAALANTVDTRVSFLATRGDTRTDVVAGADVAFLDAYDRSTVQVSGGHISWLTLHDDASADILGGDISWIRAADTSFVRLSGVHSLSWLVMIGAQSRAEIVANGVSYSKGHLSGTWGDGTPFSFWAVPPGAGAFPSMPSGISVTAVPEPAAFLLLAPGLLLIYLRARRKAPEA